MPLLVELHGVSKCANELRGYAGGNKSETAMVETMEKVCLRLWWGLARVLWYVNRVLVVCCIPFEKRRRLTRWRHNAELAEMQGSPDRAIPYYKKVIMKRPGDIGIHGALGRCYLRCFSLNEAACHLAYVLEKEPEHPEACLYTGLVSFYRKDMAQAKQYLNRAVKDFALDRKKRSMALEYLGEIALEEGSYGEAIHLLEQANEVYPAMIKSERRWVLLAEAHHLKGEERQAIEYLKTAVEQNPCSAQVWNDLGVLLWGHGKSDQARQCFRTALQIDPEYPDAKNNLLAVSDTRHYAT
jgi:tetratricopeptide (TPR) repeat protein